MTQPELIHVSSNGERSAESNTYSAFTNKKVNVLLDEFNFLVWKQQVLLAVRSLRLEKLLTGALKAPPSTVSLADGSVVENEAYEVFVAQDSALASWLLSTISASLLPQFVGAETAAQIWSIVLRFFASRSTTTVMSLHYKLRSLKKGDMSMRAYVSQVKEICNALASSGSPISDLETIATILNGLSLEYQPFVAVITASREPFTLDAAISVLLDAEVQLSSFNPLSDISSTLNVVQASVATLDTNKEGSSATRPYRQSSSRAIGRGRSGRMRLQCQLCGKLGHLVDRCWHRFDENFVPVTARSKDVSKSEVNSVFVSNSDSGSRGCSCHCAGVNLVADTDGAVACEPTLTKPRCSPAIKSADIPLVPGVTQLWADGRRTVSTSNVPELVMQGGTMSNSQSFPTNSTTMSVCDRIESDQGTQVPSPGVSTTPVGRESTGLADSSSTALVSDHGVDNGTQVEAATYAPQAGVDTSGQSRMGTDTDLPDSGNDLVTNDHHVTENVDVAGERTLECITFHSYFNWDETFTFSNDNKN
ncbi:hypothetical protein GQ457_06G027390 [Hibiscus cannabinus]